MSAAGTGEGQPVEPDPAQARDAEQAPSPWNLPNALTVLRILLVPVFAWLLLQEGGQDREWRAYAWIAFMAAIITDRFDGQIARARGIVTDFGKLADPIADKALIGTAFILLSHLGLLPWWMTILILVRELAITILRFVMMRIAVIPASRGGKMKTAWQSVVVGVAVLPFELWLGDWVIWVYWVMMAIATVITVVTGLDYVAQAIRLKREADAESKGT